MNRVKYAAGLILLAVVLAVQACPPPPPCGCDPPCDTANCMKCNANLNCVSKCTAGTVCDGSGNCVEGCPQLTLELTSPGSGDKLTFNSANPGVLSIYCDAKIISGIACDKSKISFDCDSIGNSTKTISAVNLSGGHYTCTITFTNLPSNNSGFGSKTVRVKCGGAVEDSKNIKVFYPGKATNHPGGQTPNWFYYYKQNAGGGLYKYTSAGRSISVSGGGDSTIYIGNEAYDGDQYIITTISNGYLTATGISSTNYYYANFLGVLAHERQHASNQTNSGPPIDSDSDRLSNTFETGTSHTKPNDPFSAHGFLPALAPWYDREIYAGGPVEQAGIGGANTSQDWANPGSNY